MTEARGGDGPGGEQGSLSLATIFESDLKEVKKDLGTMVKGRRQDTNLGRIRRFAWWLVGPMMTKQMDKVLALPLGDSLAEACCRLQSVREPVLKARKEWRKYQGATPEKPYPLGLKPKPPTLKLNPRHLLAAEIERWEVGSLEFDFELRFKIKGATLGVAQGCIHHLDLGGGKVEGTLTCWVKGKELGSRPLPSAPIPNQRIKFDPAIRILPLTEDPDSLAPGRPPGDL